MRQVMPWLGPSDEPAMRAWAELEIIGAYAITEPNTGSDAAGLASRAERKNGGYVINGRKNFITNGLVNDEGEPRGLLREFRQLRQAQLAYEKELGMTPASRASLGVHLGEMRKSNLALELAELRAERDEDGEAS